MTWGVTKPNAADTASAQVEDVNLPIINETDAEAEQPLEDGPSEVSAKSSTDQTSVSRTEICPEVINKEENLVAGMAFDNYDRFVDTKTGKDTLHDTVGIMYQNIDPNNDNVEEEEEEAEAEDTEGSKHNRSRRRSFESIDFELPQCAKKLKKTSNIQSESEQEVNIIVHKSLYDRIDTIWMLSHALGLLNTPMWTGFNSKVVIDDTPQQLISYLTPINYSPTSNAVVLATMQQCMKALQELNQEYMQVTYDLAIAKIALQIQATEARERWARSHDIRSSIITHVLEDLGITKKQDISAELQPHNIKKSCQQLEKFINSFDQYVNPFSTDLSPDQLFNIGSGKAASSQVEEFLLNIEKNGEEQRTTFISECTSDPKRFEKAIKKTAIHNFSSLLSKKKPVKIGGPEQVRPSDFAKELKNTKFKEALIDFFTKHWSSEEMKSFLGCDFNPAFFNKGKKKPFTLLKKNIEFQQAFATLGEENLTEDQLQQPTTLDPLEYGWIEEEEKFVFKWFEGDQLPTFVSDLITQVPDSDTMDDEDESHHERRDFDDDE
ncbi:hypothetical protein EVAR_30882_1 [Eumeta japonica]|uniref:Uncharacterized protein n=1 Tax=Eumeta variegata TaxID=151549 RepID=A0A4C1V5K7_EUMVA|nr:hypothetical protein EVAR_30882_1 [Eumeta japonica]